MSKRAMDLKVFITTTETSCGERGEELGRRAWITLVEDQGALCLSCADLDHLVFLPGGDAARIRELFPRCPPELETTITEHACLKYGGRVGRSAAAKSLDENAERLAVIAHIRHNETEYDSLLVNGYDRYEARKEVADAIARVLTQWKPPE